MHRILSWGSPQYILDRSQWVPGEIEAVFKFFEDPSNLSKITPPWLDFRLVKMEPGHIKKDARIEYRLKWFGFSYRWVTLIEDWNPGHSFVDSQLNGPYILWKHLHTFERVNGGVKITDQVVYRLPFGPIGSFLHRIIIRNQLDQVFNYRSAVVAELLFEGDESTSGSARVSGSGATSMTSKSIHMGATK